MSSATVQLGLAEKTEQGKVLIRACLSGTFGANDIKLLSAWAEGLNKAVEKAAEGRHHSVCILIDISTLEIYTDPSIITMLSDLMKKDDPFVCSTATYGGNETHEMVQQIISGMSNRDNIKNFKSENQAMEWLREGGK